MAGVIVTSTLVTGWLGFAGDAFVEGRRLDHRAVRIDKSHPSTCAPHRLSPAGRRGKWEISKCARNIVS
jgi:hypothetical protein